MIRKDKNMVALLLADGFEEIEALTPIDMLRRAGVELDSIGITGKSVTGAHGITVIADKTPDEISPDNYDAVILPGGLVGTQNIDNCAFTDEMLKSVLARGGRVAAICAAPTVLGKRGLLKGVRAVCYPGMESELIGALDVADGVVTDGQFTTARGMGVALPFAKELVRLLVGEDMAIKLSKAIVE